MLTNKVLRRLELPHEPNAWVDVRQLSYLQLDQAREIGGMRAIEKMGRMTPELRQQLTEARIALARGEDDIPQPTEDNSLAGYDLRSLLHAGIVAWSYDAPVTPDEIDQLDEQTAEYVARELVPQAEAEADRKNASSRSTRRSMARAR